MDIPNELVVAATITYGFAVLTPLGRWVGLYGETHRAGRAAPTWMRRHYGTPTLAFDLTSVAYFTLLALAAGGDGVWALVGLHASLSALMLGSAAARVVRRGRGRGRSYLAGDGGGSSE